MSNILFSDLTPIYRAVNLPPDSWVGQLEIQDDEIRTCLSRAVETDNLDESGISVLEGDQDSPSIGSKFRLQIAAPRTGLGILARDVDALLRSPKARLEEPTNYFLLAHRFDRRDASVPLIVDKYRKALELVRLLRTSAAYFDPDSVELVFVKDGKFSMPVIYGVDELNGFDVVACDKLLNFFANDLHSAQRLLILQSTVIEFCKEAEPRLRLAKVFHDLPDFYDRYVAGYNIFISEFSYDKIKDQLHTAKLEFTGKIHKAIGEIQGQLLTVPIATIVVANQMKAVTDKASELQNFAVLIGCWVFCVLFWFLCWNQWKTLDVISSEMVRQKKVIGKSYSTLTGIFSEVFDALHGRVKQQKLILIIVSVIVLAGLVVANVFYWVLKEGGSIPVKAKIIPVLAALVQ